MAENKTIKVQTELDIKIPLVPNFILSGSNDFKWHISRFNRNELEAIAEAWKAELLKKAGKI